MHVISVLIFSAAVLFSSVFIAEKVKLWISEKISDRNEKVFCMELNFCFDVKPTWLSEVCRSELWISFPCIAGLNCSKVLL